MSDKADGKDELKHVSEALSRSEQFIEKNQKNILIGLGAICIIVAGAVFYRHTVLGPKEKAAEEMIFVGEQYFAIDSFKVALNGNGADYIGFEGIIDEYGSTKTAKLAAAYAGLCYKCMGNYEKAIEYLKKSDGEDMMVSPSLVGSIGDCYVEMGNIEKATDYFEKAGATKNGLLAPIYLMKAARAYESLHKYDKALKTYEQIKSKYPLSQEGTDIDKYIERAKTMK
jgi:tetratricopeptide (TPR) repeat protein